MLHRSSSLLPSQMRAPSIGQTCSSKSARTSTVAILWTSYRSISGRQKWPNTWFRLHLENGEKWPEIPFLSLFRAMTSASELHTIWLHARGLLGNSFWSNAHANNWWLHTSWFVNSNMCHAGASWLAETALFEHNNYTKWFWKVVSISAHHNWQDNCL